MDKNYRFKEIKLRIFNKETKQLIYSNKENVAFAISAKGFTILDLDVDGNIQPQPLGDETNSIMMQGSGWRDQNNTDIYEGDVLFLRKLLAGRQYLPICGVVNVKDFTYSINSGVKHFVFDYADKDIIVLGNIFEHSDDELAAKAKVLFDKFSEKKKS